MQRRSTLSVVFALILTAVVGCAPPSKVVTISTNPPDATLRIDGRDRGKGTRTETFTFSGGIDRHSVRAEREGYLPTFANITREFVGDKLQLELKPAARRVTFSVRPTPGVVKLDGQPLSSEAVTEIQADLRFQLDPAGGWSTHVVRVEHEDFKPVERALRYEDTETVYVLDFGPLRKDLHITTVPPGADVFLDNQPLGKSPVQHDGYAFTIAPDTGRPAPQKLRIEKRGFVTKEAEIGWDDGKIDYVYSLDPLRKVVRIVTEPSEATVKLGGVELKRDAETGAHTYPEPLSFINEKGDPASYSGQITKAKTAEAEWEPLDFKIEWHNGQTEYKFTLKEKPVRPVSMLRVKIELKDGSWTAAADRTQTMAMKDESEGPDANKPVKITSAPSKTMIDSLALSPDGSELLYTTLAAEPSGEMRSQIFAQKTDGSADPARALTDGRSLELMPSFSPDGSKVVFASNRAGRKLSIWMMPLHGNPVPEQLTLGDNTDLWPTIDSSPKPWLFYESRIDRRPEPRLFCTALDMLRRKDLTPGVPATGGTQPRVAPTADAVVFAAVMDEKTGKRDIYRMNNLGGEVTNLTNTPDVDEFDPAWSSDGLRIAFASDRGRSADAPGNYDIWFIDAAGGAPAAEPTRVTGNGSWDDSPAWNADGRAIYFRSNRGGEWNVWRIDLK